MVLISGGTGFIGRILLRQLVDMGVEVRSLLKPSHMSPRLPSGIPFDVAISSLADHRGIRAAYSDVNKVIHLASREHSGSRDYNSDREIEGTRNLVEAAVEAGVERFVFLSHLGVNQTSAYTVLRTKAIEEEIIRKSGVPYTIIRSSIVFGPGDNFTTNIATQLSLLPFIYLLPGSGDTLIQPLWVKDLTTAITWTLDDPATLGQTYEIGGPEFLTYRQVLDLVMRVLNLRRLLVPFRPPYLRIGSRIMERIFRDPPVTSFWLDYLAMNRTTDLSSLPPRMPEPSGISRCLVEFGYLFPAGPDHLLDHHLGNPHPSLDNHRSPAQVDDDHPHLPPVIGINRPGGIKDGQAVLQRQATAGTELGFKPGRKGDIDTGGDEFDLSGREDHIFGHRGQEVHPGGTFTHVLREVKILEAGFFPDPDNYLLHLKKEKSPHPVKRKFSGGTKTSRRYPGGHWSFLPPRR